MIEILLKDVTLSPRKLQEKVRVIYGYFLILAREYFESEECDELDYNGVHCSCLYHAIFLMLSTGEVGQVREVDRKIRSEIAVSGY